MATAARAALTRISDAAMPAAKKWYMKTLAEGSKYVAKEPTPKACAELSKQLFYTRVASIPYRYEMLQKEWKGLGAKWAARGEMTMAEVGTFAFFGAEVMAWGCLGEIVGRGFTITGYYP